MMAQSAIVRLEIVENILMGQHTEPGRIESLTSILASLEGIPSENEKRLLLLDDSKKIKVDLSYEIMEMKKDIFYLENGEEEFIKYLEKLHPGFRKKVDSGAQRLQGLQFNCFITDRDGTINNYCGRYRSSVQSVYNSVFLTRFAKNRTVSPIIVTSAPLEAPGIVDVSVNPQKTFVYAASKGRELIDLNGRRRAYPINERKQMLIDELNERLRNLVKQPTFEKFSLIGSGFQFKFGQTTIARQDISQSIPEDESEDFLKKIVSLVSEADPKHENFRIEDTGLDIEIILTIEDPQSGHRAFDKADAVNYLDRELDLDMANGPHLICGDTSPDVAMIEASMRKTRDTWSIFVTKNNDLAYQVRSVCSNSVIVPEPDMLVTILNFLSD
ncbi:trehalose 6-phosphate synthase [Acidobacteria bacterium AH-259-G07]|nr:trehalose 6-phosphate synthase [Acidobacteria bacterium AH-259-G07]